MNAPMRLVDADSAAAYLAETDRLEPGESVRVRELTGGVSNIVLLVEREHDRPDFVIKQARAQLRVAEPWFCSVDRIWREIDVLRICQRVLASPAVASLGAARVTTPRLRFVDEQNYLFAMSAAPPHQVWKQHLLAGRTDPDIAGACGDLLGQLHVGTWNDERVARTVGDRTFFNDLRISPFYQHVATHHPALQPPLERLIESIDAHCVALVHGDFSPKNLLVAEAQLVLVDFEVGHYGDPAFDLGFFLSHLVLKALWAAAADGPAAGSRYLDLTVRFLEAYRLRVAASVCYDQLVQRAVQHFAGCALARVDGKSPVDYLHPETKDLVRQLATEFLWEAPATWPQVVARVDTRMRGR